MKNKTDKKLFIVSIVAIVLALALIVSLVVPRNTATVSIEPTTTEAETEITLDSLITWKGGGSLTETTPTEAVTEAETTAEEETTVAETKAPKVFNEEEVKKQMVVWTYDEIVKLFDEDEYSEGSGTVHYVYTYVENNSDFVVDVTTITTPYNAEGYAEEPQYRFAGTLLPNSANFVCSLMSDTIIEDYEVRYEVTESDNIIPPYQVPPTDVLDCCVAEMSYQHFNVYAVNKTDIPLSNIVVRIVYFNDLGLHIGTECTADHNYDTGILNGKGIDTEIITEVPYATYKVFFETTTTDKRYEGYKP